MMPQILLETVLADSDPALQVKLDALDPPGMGHMRHPSAEWCQRVLGRPLTDWEMACDWYEADAIRIEHDRLIRSQHVQPDAIGSSRSGPAHEGHPCSSFENECHLDPPGRGSDLPGRRDPLAGK